MTVKPINSHSQYTEIVNSGKVIVIDFWATWCGPCRAISPILEKFSDLAEYSEIEFYKVDVDDQTEIAQEAEIKAMPTFIAFKSGGKVGELVGANPRGLQNLLTQAHAQV